MSSIGAVVLAGVVVYGGFCLLVAGRQSQLMYYPDRTESATPADVGLRFDDVRLETSDGETIAGWSVPAEGDAAPTILFCHGNAGDRADRLTAVHLLHEMGFSVFIFDYRGYGSSSGKPTEAGTYADARAAWDELAEGRQVPPRAIAIYGRSLGGAVAAQLASTVSPGALLIESSFTSAPDMARHLYPWLPVRALCRFRYNTRGIIPDVDCPVLVAHSPDDDLIPFEQGRAVFEAAGEPKQFVSFGGDHNAGGLEASPAYQRDLERFVQEHVGKAMAIGRRDAKDAEETPAASTGAASATGERLGTGEI